MNSSLPASGQEYIGEDIPEHSRTIFIIVGIFYIIVGVVGNIVIIVSIATTKSMRSPHYYFIANLAVADIVLTGYCLPWLVVSLTLRYYPAVSFGQCVFNGFMTVCGYVASLLSLLAISLNRYLNVCHNDVFLQLFSNKLVSSMSGCALIWMVAILCTLPCLTGWGRFIFDRKLHYCGYDRTYSFSYTLFLLLCSIGIPAVLIFLCNFRIWRYVRQASHRIYAATRGDHPRNNRGQRAVQLSKQGQGRKIKGQTGNSYPVADVEASTSSSKVESIENYRLQDEKDKQASPSPASNHLMVPKTPFVVMDEGRREENQEAETTLKTTSPLVTPDELALMKTVFTVFLGFAILMCPYMVSCLVDTRDQWSSVLHVTCTFTSYTNCCVNCLLYGAMSPRFRKAFKAVFEMLARKLNPVSRTTEIEQVS